LVVVLAFVSVSRLMRRPKAGAPNRRVIARQRSAPSDLRFSVPPCENRCSV